MAKITAKPGPARRRRVESIPGIELMLADLPEDVRTRLEATKPTDRDVFYFHRGWSMAKTDAALHRVVHGHVPMPPGRTNELAAREQDEAYGPPAGVSRVPPMVRPPLQLVRPVANQDPVVGNVDDMRADLAGESLAVQAPPPPRPVPDGTVEAEATAGDYPYVEGVLISPKAQQKLFNFATAMVERQHRATAYQVVQELVTAWSTKDRPYDVPPSSWEGELTHRFGDMEILKPEKIRSNRAPAGD